MTKQRRGPGVQDPVGASPEALAALAGSSLDSGALVAWLGEVYGVRRFEIDDLAQGVAVPPLPAGVRLSLYRPWVIVTATRTCPWIFDGRTWNSARGCARPCAGRRLVLSPEDTSPSPTLPQPPPLEGGECAGDTSPSRGEGRVGVARTRFLVLGGCAQFLHVDPAGRPLPPGVDRVVWQPAVPS